MFLCTFKTVFVFICLCAFCAFCIKQATFFFFDVLCAFKTVFVFICLCAFYVFMLVRFFRERYKTSPIPSFSILLHHYNTFYYHHNTFLSSPQYISIITTIHFYHHNTFSLSQYISTITIHFHYYNTHWNSIFSHALQIDIFLPSFFFLHLT